MMMRCDAAETTSPSVTAPAQSLATAVEAAQPMERLSLAQLPNKFENFTLMKTCLPNHINISDGLQTS
jgi:hypothetical protein